MNQIRNKITKLLIIDLLQSLKIDFDESIDILKETIEEIKNIL